MFRLFAFLLAWIIISGFGLVNAEAQARAATVASTQTSKTLSAKELDELVGRIALFPDELVAIILPASTYPLQIVQAARFLDRQKKNPKLKPRKDWDTSIIGLLNYSQIIKMMNEDLDWIWKLGEAVVAQQKDVMAAIQQFRARARAAGNLKTNKKQTIVIQKTGTVIIKSPTQNVIYVPQYNPALVVVVGAAPVVYSAPYPAYYAPGAAFFTGMFVGAAIGYGLNWNHYHINHYNNFHGNINRNVNRNVNRNQPQKWSPGNRSGARPGQRPSTRPGQRPGARPGQRPRTQPANRQRRQQQARARQRQQTQARQRHRAPQRRQPSANRARYNPSAFKGYGRGVDQRRNSNRGRFSRSSMQRNSGFQRGGRRGGGRRRR